MKSSKSILITLIALVAVALPGELGAQHVRYKLVDIGTFGGPESYVNPGGAIGSPRILNSSGVVVGGAGTSIPLTMNSSRVICGGVEGFPWLGVNHALEWQNGTLTDLGSLAGPENCSVATSINSSGEVSGHSENGVIDPVAGFNGFHAVLWKNGTIRDLGTLGGRVSAGSGINKWGQVAGFALNGIPDPVSIYHFQIVGSTSGTQTRAFLWTNGVMRDLGTLGGPDAWSNFVNDAGQVAGSSYTDSIINPATGVPTTHPFLWDEANGMTDLGTLGGTLASSEVANLQGALNNLGQVVGGSYLAGDETFHPFLWTTPGPMQDLGTLGGNNAGASAINDAGEVVGTADLPGNVSHAFRFTNGVMTDLGTLNGYPFSTATSINAQGQIVGSSCLISCENHFHTRAVLFENGSIFDLNKLILGGHAGLTLTIAFAINDLGEIAGVGTPPGCLADTACSHAFLLIPCAEITQGCEDNAQDTAAATENKPDPIADNPAISTSRIPTNSGMAGWRTRLAQRYHIRGLGASPRY